MKVIIYLDTHTATALRRPADEIGASNSEATILAVPEYLIAIGMLELSTRDTEMTGMV